MEKYEINFVNNPYYYCQRLICMLTGHDLDEVINICGKKNHGFRIRVFKDTIQKLGFNCNQRVMPFDASTKYPCLLKAVGKNEKGKEVWYAMVYYDNVVYIPGHGKYTLEEYKKEWPDELPKSMLQVWI